MRLPLRTEPRSTIRASRTLVAALLATGLLAGCVEPPPRSFQEFMEDRIAREAVLARCDGEDETRNDIDCANARRAAAIIALSEERERRERLERESERKIQALREQIAQRDAAVRQAALEARRAYDEQWENGTAGDVTAPGVAPAPGAADGPEPGSARSESGAAEAEAPAEAPIAERPDVLAEVELPARSRIERSD